METQENIASENSVASSIPNETKLNEDRDTSNDNFAVPNDPFYNLIEKQAKEFEEFGKRISLDLQSSYKEYLIQRNEDNKVEKDPIEIEKVCKKYEEKIVSQSQLIDSLKARIEELETDSIIKNQDIRNLRQELIDFKKEIQSVLAANKKSGSNVNGKDLEILNDRFSDVKLEEESIPIETIENSPMLTPLGYNEKEKPNEFYYDGIDSIPKIGIIGNSSVSAIDSTPLGHDGKEKSNKFYYDGIIPIGTIDNSSVSAVDSPLGYNEKEKPNHKFYYDGIDSIPIGTMENYSVSAIGSTQLEYNKEFYYDDEYSTPPNQQYSDYELTPYEQNYYKGGEITGSYHDNCYYNDNSDYMQTYLTNEKQEYTNVNPQESYTFESIRIEVFSEQRQRQIKTNQKIHGKIEQTLGKLSLEGEKPNNTTFDYLRGDFNINFLLEYEKSNLFRSLSNNTKRCIKSAINEGLRRELLGKKKKVSQPIKVYVNRKLIPSLPAGIKSYAEFQKTSKYDSLLENKKRMIQKVISVEKNILYP